MTDYRRTCSPIYRELRSAFQPFRRWRAHVLDPGLIRFVMRVAPVGAWTWKYGGGDPMSNDQLDISALFAWDDDLPRPHWDEVAKLVESKQAGARWDAWNTVVRQWLESLGNALDGAYEIVESDNFVTLAADAGLGQTVVRVAEQCRVALLSVLGELADFGGSGKDVVLLLRSQEEYYGYLDCFIPDGEHGGSGGMHIRDGLPHVALWGAEIDGEIVALFSPQQILSMRAPPLQYEYVYYSRYGDSDIKSPWLQAATNIVVYALTRESGLTHHRDPSLWTRMAAN